MVSIWAAWPRALALSALIALAGPAFAETRPAAENAPVKAYKRPMSPHARHETQRPEANARTRLVSFEATPFPYKGANPDHDGNFLDVSRDGRAGHTSPRGGLYWEDETYSDKDVLLSLPPGLDFGKPVLIVLFLHGNQARLVRDVWNRQHVPQQVAASELNAVLVAPQFALDALDSSAGRFWEPGFLKTFLAEAAVHLARISDDPRAEAAFEQARVVIVAYSGGYLPAAYALQWGGDGARIAGVVLLDGLYGEEQRMAAWIARRGAAFFFSAYSPSTRAANEELQSLSKDQNIAVVTALPGMLRPGSITFLRTPLSVVHNDFLSQAWTKDPLKAVLNAIKGDENARPVPSR